MSLFGGVIPVTGITFLIASIFVIAFAGYVIGRINIKGVDLGTAGVFIAALLYGCLFYNVLASNLTVNFTVADEVYKVAYTKEALKIVENIGLILFITSVGFIAGPKFFGDFKRNFKSYVLLGFVIIVTGGLVAAACILIGRQIGLGDTTPQEFTAIVAGLFSGALTSTPAFSAAKATAGSDYEDYVAVGNGIAYIFGVIGVVLFVQLIPKIIKADMDKERALLSVASQVDNKAKAFSAKLIEFDPFGLCAFALAAVVGIFFGMIKIPLSSQGLSGTTFSLTTTGGCLLTALVFGHFRKIGRVSIMPKDATLKVLRELGLMLFLIGAGIAGGAKFVECFKPIYFVYGIFITIIPMLVGFFFAKYVLKLNLLNNLGSITGGMTSTPALGTLISSVGTEDVAAAYAATYPIALIAVVLVSQFLIILFV
ncbi:MAG: permease [Saccharofermentans sp.]|nr:permease [Saccharofermentans sp.]